MATKMKMGECRETKNGQTYCMTRVGVRFKKGGGRRLSGSGRTSTRRRSGTKGKTCKRYQRVPMRGVRGTVRRCKSYS